MNFLLCKSSQFILSHRQGKSLRSKFSGGKAANLARLTKWGFNVPPFFVLSTSLYWHILKINGIDRLISKLKSNHSSQICTSIRSQILAAEIPTEIAERIQLAAKQLLIDAPTKAVAVRSSAVAEDQRNRSFAGQLDSFLNIQNESQLHNAIKQCWASLWGERAQMYSGLAKQRLPDYSMSVIIQQMIPADYAGICFTIDPADRSGEWLLIEAKPGIGADLASGTANPWRYRAHRSTLALQGEPTALDAELLVELAKTALRIERLFGMPQDIEWAIYHGQIFILQSRAITARLGHSHGADQPLWSNYFFGERFPLPVSPLGWSILKPIIELNAFREPLSFLGFNELARAQITRCFFGRPYTRLEVFQALHSLFPSDYVAREKRELFYPQPVSLAHSLRQVIKRIIPIAKSLATTNDWLPPVHLRNWKQFLARYCHHIRLLQGQKLHFLPDQKLWQAMLTAESLSNSLLKLHRWSITFAELHYHFLIWLIRKWLPQLDADATVAALHRGIPGNLTVEMNIALWQLSRHNEQEPLQGSKSPSNPRLATDPEWQSFLRRFGHRSTNLDIATPTFAEGWDSLWRLILQYRISPDQSSPAVKQQAFEQQRRTTEELVLHHLSQAHWGWLKSRFFQILLNWSQQFFSLRENQRHYWHFALALKRNIALELGQRLIRQGWLDEPDQIFFLTRHELMQMILHHLPSSKTNIIERIKQHRRWQQVHPPALIDESQSATLSANKNLKKLTGISAGPGIATGIARILTSLIQFPMIQPGEILVVPTTDPGWTPLFGTIRGLVMEVGGILSHGAIIAREFGIPAVTSVERATERIPNGARITVDGNNGVVIIHDVQNDLQLSGPN
ncbi:MAG: PEP-utilizing enzyme [candidate division KSB1 bacterium]|nr:PEP-utilizing enzyme [candidate division KSB1 bacterium]